MSEITELLAAPIDVRRLVSKLAFNLDNFEQANMEQPRLYLEAGRYRTKAALDKARAELQLEVTMAETGAQWRERPTSGKAMTEKAIADKITLNKEVIKLRQRAYMAKVTEEWAKQLLEAYSQRLMVLGIIGKVRSSEIASELRAVKEQAAIQVVRREAEKVRRKLGSQGDDE